MATIHEIPAQSRKDEGKGASRRLRHAGQVPAVLYGAKEAPVSLQLEHNAVYLAGQHEWFYSSILDLVIDGKPQLRAMTAIPVVMEKCVMCHAHYKSVKKGAAIGALTYTLPIK